MHWVRARIHQSLRVYIDRRWFIYSNEWFPLRTSDTDRCLFVSTYYKLHMSAYCSQQILIFFLHFSYRGKDIYFIYIWDNTHTHTHTQYGISFIFSLFIINAIFSPFPSFNNAVVAGGAPTEILFPIEILKGVKNVTIYVLRAGSMRAIRVCMSDIYIPSNNFFKKTIFRWHWADVSCRSLSFHCFVRVRRNCKYRQFQTSIPLFTCTLQRSSDVKN